MKKQITGAIVASMLSLPVLAQDINVMNQEGLNYGPLQHLIGEWVTGPEMGTDIAPGRGTGAEVTRRYTEKMVFSEVGTVRNANSQNLNVLHYSHEVYAGGDINRKFHDQRGYLAYDAETHTVYNTFCGPRGTCVVAEGAAGTAMRLTASKEEGSISESMFMAENASTPGFLIDFILGPDSLSYRQITHLDIYDLPNKFEHVDFSVLVRAE